MAYSWEEVIMGIDIKREMDEKRRQQEEIEAKASKEQGLMSAWSLGLSILGGLALGPAGVFLGKQAGKWGTDIGVLPWTKDASQWESERIDEGKFFSKDAAKINKQIEKKAKEVNQAQLLDSVIDLGTMWMQAGGLQEGFADEGFFKDLTTFGTGDSAWTAFGKKGDPFTGSTWSAEGAGGMIDPVTGKAIGSAPMPTGTPDIPGLFTSDKGGFWSGLKSGAGRIGKTIGQEQTVQGIATGATSLERAYQQSLNSEGS